ncbi:GNAT family N-acetyltransferase [Maribacter sp. 2307ULW6-5]|uniref:GNAT family N-acetyltransferase n=1 Tax=Maribacter sp. 2307ULW6-5 TaxID=3386275 RepID=UPI0039BD48B0
MEIVTKTFGELDVHTLYELLRLRTQVFVVEQDCVYQDLDGKDDRALHVLGIKNGELVAYTRIFQPGLYFKEAAIGRVVVQGTQRKHGYGKVIMKASIAAIEERFKERAIKISAQTHLKKFYQELGFEQVGEGYLEDGIPHIGMLRS